MGKTSGNKHTSRTILYVSGVNYIRCCAVQKEERKALEAVPPTFEDNTEILNSENKGRREEGSEGLSLPQVSSQLPESHPLLLPVVQTVTQDFNSESILHGLQLAARASLYVNVKSDPTNYCLVTTTKSQRRKTRLCRRRLTRTISIATDQFISVFLLRSKSVPETLLLLLLEVGVVKLAKSI